MQQQVQVNQPAEQIINEAATFFSKRRVRITDRSGRGFRFGLEGSDASDSGQVKIEPGKGGVSNVTVQADAVGILAVADSFVRELRKQSRSMPRTGSASGDAATRGGFGDLRRRLGMPEPAPPRRPAVAPAAAAAPAPPGDAAPPENAVSPTAATPARDSLGAERPDGPRPTEAPHVSPQMGPQSTPAPADAAAPIPHPAETGPKPPPAHEPEQKAPSLEALAATSPSAEQQGGVPSPDQVTVHSVSESAIAPTADPSRSEQPASGSDEAAAETP